ncbi:hypothetical protein Y032_0299g1784 [Ancylostoma ceylanicum]|uniref:Uncharacterized protein n=1 Tax=Ancylostoma ceylanicum TaxID=53326 RepID=A0A016S4G8_9BILA|nr:hypothetical protein Y032_0299g1784 [Ancylostoma ceylanicum]
MGKLRLKYDVTLRFSGVASLMRKPLEGEIVSMEPEDILLEDEHIQRPVPKKLLLSKNEDPASGAECELVF